MHLSTKRCGGDTSLRFILFVLFAPRTRDVIRERNGASEEIKNLRRKTLTESLFVKAYRPYPKRACWCGGPERCEFCLPNAYEKKKLKKIKRQQLKRDLQKILLGHSVDG